jgi:DNA ligase (NAD+)
VETTRVTPCFTFGAMRIVSEARTLVESLGAMTASTVSKKVDFVVVGEDPGSKFDKAKELGVKTLTEEEFKKMVG